MRTHAHGWQPDLPDHRDHMFRVVRAARLPVHVDLTPKMPPVFDQGQLGSCTANALASTLAFEHGGGPYSRLQISVYST